MCIIAEIPLDFALKQNPYMINKIIDRLNSFRTPVEKEKVSAHNISKYISEE